MNSLLDTEATTAPLQYRDALGLQMWAAYLDTLDEGFDWMETARPALAEDSTRDYGLTQCGHCERVWDDNAVSHLTPTPSARCPFEYEHTYTD